MEKQWRMLLSVIDVNYLEERASSKCTASKVVLDSKRFSPVLGCLKGVTEMSQIKDFFDLTIFFNQSI